MKKNPARLGAIALGLALVATAIAGSPAMAAQTAKAPPPLSADRCAALVGATIEASDIGLPTTGATVKTATWVVESGGGQCRVVGDIHPVDPQAPAIEFQVNLPENWNERAPAVRRRRVRRHARDGPRAVPAAARRVSRRRSSRGS